MTRRVVVTGIGAVTPIGSGSDGLWNGLRRGTSAVGPIKRFDPSPFSSKIAAEIDGFDPLDHLDARQARRLDRFSQLTVVAGHQALIEARLGLDFRGSDAVAIFLGSALGGIAFAEEQHRRFLAGGFHAVDPMLALAVYGGAGATNLAIEFGIQGPVHGNANSCASGLIAIGDAFRAIRSGEARIALAGGAEAPLAPLTFGAFARIKAMSTSNQCPAQACRPFDLRRDGFVMGEGAAILVLEELASARQRGARPYAEVLGYGSTNDAFHPIVPEPTGREAARAISLALAEAGVPPSRVDYLNAHATGTQLGDLAECVAIHRAFGDRTESLPVSGTKGLHGHALGASGAIEAAIVTMVIQHGWLPPTANLDSPDPRCAAAHVLATGRDMPIDIAVTNSFGFGGINASLVLRRWRES